MIFINIRQTGVVILTLTDIRSSQNKHFSLRFVEWRSDNLLVGGVCIGESPFKGAYILGNVSG